MTAAAVPKASAKTRARYRVAGRARPVTRDLAALAFLSSIPMAAEEARVHEAATTLGLGAGDDGDLCLDSSDENSDGDGDGRATAGGGGAGHWSLRLLRWVQRRLRLGGYGDDGEAGLGRHFYGHDYGEESDEDGTRPGLAEVWERSSTDGSGKRAGGKWGTLRGKATAAPLEMPVGWGGGGGMGGGGGGPAGRRLVGPPAAEVSLLR